MKKTEFAKGDEWAYRVPSRTGEPPARVRLLEYASTSRKVKVEHVEGRLEGLKEWVPPGHLLTRWADVDALLAQESKRDVLDEYVRATLDGLPDRALEDAVSLVLEAAGEPDVYLRDRHGYGEAPPNALSRLCARAGLDADELTRRPAYLRNAPYLNADRRHWRHWVLPWDRLVALAHGLAQAEPEHVTRWVDHEEAQLVREGYLDRADRWAHDWLRRQLPAHALVRQWAGSRDDRIEFLEGEVRRFRRLLDRASRDLRRAGREDAAQRLARDAGPARS